MKKWFTGYVAGYYTGDPEYDRPIRLKEDHTAKVRDAIVMLGRSVDLTDHDLVLAETVALFHDVGRFEQYTRHGTFNDMASENHAKLGLREMAKHKVLSPCTPAEKRLISKAIAYHNAAALPENQGKRDRLFMALIRDADKLDVWRVLIAYYAERKESPSAAIELDLPDTPTCSPKIIDALSRHQSALMKDAETINDVMLLQISWVYDLNFSASFQMVRQRQYVNRLSKFLPPSAVIRRAVEQAQAHVDSSSD